MYLQFHYDAPSLQLIIVDDVMCSVCVCVCVQDGNVHVCVRVCAVPVSCRACVCA